ncbi:hypothetical protein WN55_02739 [Dufourea novaeangliae]|uniref:Uncharacterized protein n=1 Tax=Dufourea novaeangliae TaxID=178035 RepID=A0A154NXM9_DUFNO|nr:hypothetical protein WN55_02739 [Dufourea novaeangliae]
MESNSVDDPTKTTVHEGKTVTGQQQRSAGDEGWMDQTRPTEFDERKAAQRTKQTESFKTPFGRWQRHNVKENGGRRARGCFVRSRSVREENDKSLDDDTWWLCDENRGRDHQRHENRLPSSVLLILPRQTPATLSKEKGGREQRQGSGCA